MQLLLKIDQERKDSLQRQLIDQIRSLILDGYLNPGTQLPSSRELCKQLDISRNTVLNAYAYLISEGYLITKLASGTFVAKSIPENAILQSHQEQPSLNINYQKARYDSTLFNSKAPGLYNPENAELKYDFTIGSSDSRLFPVKTWKRLTNARMASAAHPMSRYGNPAGLYELREIIADYIGSTKSITASPDQIIITSGGQQSVNIVSHLFLQSGEKIIVEAPCSRGARYIFESHGAKLVAIPVDEQGINVGCFPDEDFRLAYLTPSHQFALGVTLSQQRRLEVIEWASRTNAYLIEDNYDGDFRYEGSPLPALQTLDSGNRVIYMDSYSKSIGAGIRLGYIVVPEELIEPTKIVKALLDNGSSWLEQAVLADFIKQKSFNSHLRLIRHTYMTRRDCLISCLQKYFGKIELSGIEGGTHLAWRLSKDFPLASDLRNKMRRHGIGISSLRDSFVSEYACSVDVDRMVLLGYGALNEEKIDQGITLLAEKIEAL